MQTFNEEYVDIRLICRHAPHTQAHVHTHTHKNTHFLSTESIMIE